MLFLSSIGGGERRSVAPVDRCDAAKRMRSRADAGLGELGMTFAHAARTWIYLEDILSWHGAFDDVRTASLRERGIGGGENGRPFPASTGIRGASGSEECVRDLCAVGAEPGADVRRADDGLRVGDRWHRSGRALDARG